MASYHLPEILRCTVLASVAAEDDSAAAVAVGFAGAELGSGGVRRLVEEEEASAAAIIVSQILAEVSDGRSRT